MSDALIVAILSLIGVVVSPLLLEWYKGRRRQSALEQPASGTAPEPTSGKTPEPTSKPRSEPTPYYDVEGFPLYLGISELPAGADVLLPYDTPTAMLRELAQAPPLSRSTLAHDAFVGRRVRWSGVVSSVLEGHRCYRFLAGYRDDVGLLQHVTLVFQIARRHEVERLREGDPITYEGQIRSVEAIGVELVRVKIGSA